MDPTAIDHSHGPTSSSPAGKARAIEVAAMLGDSVVAVKHLSNPRGGRISWLTYALLGLGAAALIISAIAFSKAVGNAELNQEASRYHTDVLKLPHHEFRPHRISLAYDWMAFGGLASALLAFAVGLVRLRNERVPAGFTIGCERTVDFPTDPPAASNPSFPLIVPRDNDFLLNFVTGMEGEIATADSIVSFGELIGRGQVQPSRAVAGGFETTIPGDARIRIEHGKNRFIISSVAPPRRHPVPLFASLSTTVVAFFAGSAIVHLGLWSLLRTIPPDPRSLALDLGSREGVISHIETRADEDPIEQIDETDSADDSETPGGTGEQMALTAGKMGNPESSREAGRYTIEDKGVSPQLAKQRAIDAARQQGIAGALQGDIFSSMTGTADFSSGLHDRTVYGGMAGDEVGEMHGGFGFGVAGFGPGAGGTGWGTIGAGRYGTIGWGNGTGSGYSTGSGKGPGGKRQSALPTVNIGQPTTTGIDKSIIRRYIRRKLPRIKYCYEKQLLVRPGLTGTVISSFQISPTGSVIGSDADGMSDEVSTCVADVIQSIQFPKTSTGLVQVRYPFIFRPTGGN